MLTSINPIAIVKFREQAILDQDACFTSYYFLVFK